MDAEAEEPGTGVSFADRRSAPYIPCCPGQPIPDTPSGHTSRTHSAVSFDSNPMEHFRSLSLTRFVSGVLATALLCAIVTSFSTNRAGDQMVDRVSRSFSGDEVVMTAATEAAAESPASFDEFLVEFVGRLEESGGSAGEILIGHAMSTTRLLDLLRQRFSNELAPAVSPRQIVSMAATASTLTRDRDVDTSTVKQAKYPSRAAGPVVVDAEVTARVVSCGFRCSSVQPLGP